MAISFGRAALAFAGGAAKGIVKEREQKKEDERAYLDRYTQAAQNAMRFAETDRRERNVKVESHRKNLGLITAALKQTGASDSEVRQVAAQIYNQNRTAEGAQIAAQRLTNAIVQFENDPEARMEVFNDLKATIDPESTTTLEQFSQYFAGPRTGMQAYMPDMGTFDSRTSLDKLFGVKEKEPESITQTREMYKAMGRKEGPVPSLSIPEGSITLPSETSDKNAEQLSTTYYNLFTRFKDKDPAKADEYLKKYNQQQLRIRTEAANKRFKDAKAPLSLKDINTQVKNQMSDVQYLSDDVERFNMIAGVGKEGDVGYTGQREALFRIFKHAKSLPDSGSKTEYLNNLEAAGPLNGISPPENMSVYDLMQKYDKTRIGAASLDVFRDTILNGKKAYDIMINSEGKDDAAFKGLSTETQQAVMSLYDADYQVLNGKSQDQYVQEIAEAFFLPIEGAGRYADYISKLKKTLGIKGLK